MPSLEGQQKLPPDGPGERKPPSWVKANRPARPKKERKKRGPRLRQTARGADPSDGTRHGHLPPLPGAAAGRAGMWASPGDYPTPPSGTGDRARGAERTCPQCQKRWAPKPDWGSLTVGRQRVGISVQSEVSVLREECRLPFGVIQRYLKGRYGLHLSVGELVALVRGVAVHGQEEYSQLQQAIRDSPVVHGTRRAGGKMVIMGTSGASALPGCVTCSTAPVGQGQWWRRCWGRSLMGCWSATSMEPTTCTRAASALLGPPFGGRYTN